MKRIDENHSFNVNVCQALGHIEKSILLKEIYGWCHMNKAKGKNIRLDMAWTYMPAKGYADKFPYMNPKSISRWLKQLEKDGLIFSHNFNRVAYDRTKWYTINYSAYDYAVQHSEISISQNEEWISQIKESISHFEESNTQNEEPIPSTTTSTTTTTTKEREKKENSPSKDYEVTESLSTLDPVKNKEKPKKKSSAKRKKVGIPSPNYPTEYSKELTTACEAYFEHRKQIGQPFSSKNAKQTKIMQTTAQVAEYGESKVIASFYEAITEGWKMNYIRKDDKTKKNAKTNSKKSGESLSIEELFNLIDEGGSESGI